MTGKNNTRRTGSLFRMLQDKLELERSFGVEDVPYVEPGPIETPQPREESTVTKNTPREPEASVDGSKAERLATLEREMSDCQLCPLGATRTNLVFGVGSADADLMFIGEAPGADEDAQGIPFVGRAGQLLTKIINAMGLSRDKVYIGNILKCRPPENRNPRPSEVVHCLPHLRRQIAIIDPKVLVCLGGVAAGTLLQSDTPVGRLRGRFHDYEGHKLLVTYHPAYLLRNPSGKPAVWDDMKMVLNSLGLPIPKHGK